MGERVLRLACKAFADVFQRRQTQHGALLAWIERRMAAVRPLSRAERCMLDDAVAWRAGQRLEMKHHGSDDARV
jgi:hypothetical protein